MLPVAVSISSGIRSFIGREPRLWKKMQKYKSKGNPAYQRMADALQLFGLVMASPSLYFIVTPLCRMLNVSPFFSIFWFENNTTMPMVGRTRGNEWSQENQKKKEEEEEEEEEEEKEKEEKRPSTSADKSRLESRTWLSWWCTDVAQSPPKFTPNCHGTSGAVLTTVHYKFAAVQWPTCR